MPRKPRHGARICARCKQRETKSVWRTYCPECERIQHTEYRARVKAAAAKIGADLTDNEKLKREYARIWQEQNEQMIIGPLANINPPPGGYAITAPGKKWIGDTGDA